MRILADQDVWQKTIDLLRRDGHDVVTARELDLSLADDATLLQRSAAEERIFLTRDKDFGRLVFLKELKAVGVIFLRITPSVMDETHNTLMELVQEVSVDGLSGHFCTVEPSKYRRRKLPGRREQL